MSTSRSRPGGPTSQAAADGPLSTEAAPGRPPLSGREPGQQQSDREAGRDADRSADQEAGRESGPEPGPPEPDRQALAPPPREKKRRRPALACEQCRRRKIKCDRTSPCGNCTRARIASCTYVPTHVPASAARPKTKARPLATQPCGVAAPRPQLQPQPQLQPRLARSNAAAAVPSSSKSSPPSAPGSSMTGSASQSSNVEILAARVHELEDKLSRIVHISDRHSSHDDLDGRHDSTLPIPAGTVAKTRYLGASHWANIIDLLPTEYALLGRAQLDKTDFCHVLVQCKALARRIKALRYRPLSSDNLGKHIPPRLVADQLVDNYLRTFEGVLRILHVPSFRADYERYWQNSEAANDAFVMQMQLCMALGAVINEDYFTMRATAIQWIQEAQLWLMLPPEKSKMTIPVIQISCLLLLAKPTCGVGADLTCITCGSLVRKAMYMGLHRDPSHLGKMTTFRAEMRRRLWATILELNIQASFESGGSPLLLYTDYDTLPPANMNDELLGDETDGEGPAGEPPDVPTQMSVQISILKSLPLRLDLLRKANDFGRGQPYDEVLRLNSELTKACRELSRRLSSLRTRSTAPGKACISTFHVSVAELYLYRFFHALHQSVIVRSFDDQRFYFSRRMCLDSALKLMHIYGLSGPAPLQPPEGFADFRRVVTNGAGTFRYIPVQALLFVAVELIHQKKGQSASLGYLPALGDADLRSCLDAAEAWTIERVRSGETNCKSHCFVAAAAGHVEALGAGLDQEGVDENIVRRATASAKRCLQALHELARREGLPADEAGGAAEPMDGVAEMQPDWMEDWAWDDGAEMPWPQWELGAFDGMAMTAPGQFLGP